MARHRNQLDIPPGPREDSNASELARIWCSEDVQFFALDVASVPEPGAWGIHAMDLMRNAARAYEQLDGRSREETYRRILAALNAEREHPTETRVGEQGSTHIRFVVRDVFQITGRGRVISGEFDTGRITMGDLVRPEHAVDSGPWRVVGIEFLDSPPTGGAWIGLELQDAPAVEELRRLCPRGSAVVGA